MHQFFIPPAESITPNHKETARYLGYSKLSPPDEQINQLILRASTQLHAALKPQATYAQFPLLLQPPAQLTFADTTLNSVDLSRNLTGCTQVVLFAATLGPQVDALIRKTQLQDAAYASVLQATGAMYIEEVVNLLNEKIKLEAKEKGLCARPRFSPGYGDVPLEVQKTFFNLLPCQHIGLSLMDSLIMAPEKSVTAFIGLK